ncbi:Vacuolar protein-sorting-associated protein 25 [Coemansia biformis]|uniref:Vacuolar protein-sorting-associated protein 25 n=1 Tax=Coemansia biformis TaxID=1286918 RepID=A0A9W7XT35_9FUNG|nr:Vacuolar protein-sorting-associated protein 25 [Coemansia biformis]
MATTTDANAQFQLPEIHNFPPFFTRQPNEDTWKEQRRLWCDLILAFYRHHRRCTMSLAEAVTEPPFSNRQIHRSLRVDALREIVDDLVKQGKSETARHAARRYGSLATQQPPEVWAGMMHQWASDHGLCNAVLTLYELANGDDTVGQEFHDLDLATLRRSLEALQSQGKAQLFVGSSDDDVGVKFFA